MGVSDNFKARADDIGWRGIALLGGIFVLEAGICTLFFLTGNDAAIPMTVFAVIFFLFMFVRVARGAKLYMRTSTPFTPGASGESSRINRIGLPAEALILGIHDTMATVNQVGAILKFTLEVRVGDLPPFQTEIREVISRTEIPRYQVGMTVPVKYDPGNPKKVALA